MAKVTKSVSGDTVTFTEDETTLIDDVLDAALAPIKLLSADENTFYSGRTLGLASAGYGLGGYALGARKPDIIPFFGVRD